MLLKGLGIGGAALAGASLTPVGSAADPTDFTPFDLHFELRDTVRPFDLLSPGFVAHHAGWAALPELTRTEVGPLAPYAAVRLDVAEVTGTLRAGLVAENGDAVLGHYDSTARTVRIEVTRDGQTAVVAEAEAELGAAFRFCCVLNENTVAVLADTGAGWQPLLRAHVVAHVDLRVPATLARFHYGYGGQHAVGAVDAGYFGQVGVRDPHLVTYADGTPYVRDGRVYLTHTSAGLGFFQTAHWGVWSVDLDDPTDLRQEAHLFFERGGLVLGDHAGHLVVEDDGEVLVAVSGWGDFDGAGVRVQYARATSDVLAGVHVLRTEPLPLPTEVSAWDPALTRIGDTWYVAFVESPSQDPFVFHPALAVGRPGGGPEELTSVGADTSVDQTEGTILQKIGGTWYLLASDGDARQYRVYDLRVEFLGTLSAPYGTNIPHPMVIPVSEAGRTRYLLLSFDGTQYAEPALGYGTHGDFLVMAAPETRPGHEFEPRRP